MSHCFSVTTQPTMPWEWWRLFNMPVICSRTRMNCVLRYETRWNGLNLTAIVLPDYFVKPYNSQADIQKSDSIRLENRKIRCFFSPFERTLCPSPGFQSWARGVWTVTFFVLIVLREIQWLFSDIHLRWKIPLNMREVIWFLIIIDERNYESKRYS